MHFGTPPFMEPPLLIPSFRMNCVETPTSARILRTYLGVESEAPDLKSLMLQEQRLSRQAPYMMVRLWTIMVSTR